MSEKEELTDEGAPLCSECSSLMIQENGDWICPKCEGEIDYFGDREEINGRKGYPKEGKRGQYQA